MADNITITQGTGTTIATEDISDVQHQKVKIEFGGDGVAKMVSDADPLPVTGTFYQTTQPISAASLPLPASASTSANQTTIIGHVDGIETLLETIDGKITSCNTGAVVLAAGSATIGKLASNSGVDIGDVDILSIAAGDNNIGNVDIASAIPPGTNNIGDVDVLTVPRSLSGPGQPGTAVDSYSHVAISASANTANQSLVAAPGANKQIWVYGISYVVGTGAGSVSFQDEDDTAVSGIMAHALNSGMAIPPSGNFSMPIWKVATNKALEVDTVTCDIKGWISYAIVSV